MDVVEDLLGNSTLGGVAISDLAITPLYVRRRREKIYKSFFSNGRNDCTPYLNWDIPAVAIKWLDTWENIVVPDPNKQLWHRSFFSGDLNFIENNFRCILIASNKIGKFHTRGRS